MATSPSSTRERAASFDTAAAMSGEPPGVVAAVAADQAHALAVLVREHAPSVDLLLEDPPVAVERLADERRSGRRVEREHDELFYAKDGVLGPRVEAGPSALGKGLRGDHLDQHLAHGVHIWPHLTPPDPTADVREVLGNNRLVLHLLDTVRTT